MDDDEHVSMLVTRYLALDGYSSEQAKNAAEALDAIRHRRPDLVLLDVMMPGRDGLDLLEQLRAEGDDLPVIVLSARGDEGDRIAGLRLGADDYVAKPFSPAELVARVTAVLRRGDGSPRRETLAFEGLSIDMATRRVTVSGEVVPTTTREFALLAFLPRHRTTSSPETSCWRRCGARRRSGSIPARSPSTCGASVT